MTINTKNLKKSFNGKLVFKDLNLEVKSGKITAIFGPNGCGKSTLFNILSGIITKNGGEYNIVDFDKYKFSYMPQNYRESLLPWRKNFDNIALPLQIQKLPKNAIKKQIVTLYGSFGFNLNLNSYPYELSGGQQQFLIFLRSLITKPSILLLDEPFSALDFENNIRLRNKLQEYYLSYKPTILVITHDIEEAVYLASEIIVFSRRPARVLGKIKNPLQYPRDIDILKSEEFHRLKNKVLKLFRSEVGL